VLVALVLVVVGLLAWWILAYQPSRRRVPASEAEVPTTVETKHVAGWAPREEQPPAPGCTPRAATVCSEGDVWWQDSCGAMNERKADCGDRRCVDGACDEGPGCGDVTALGRCDRDVARICQVDRVMETDCGVEKKRCVMTDEGPMCRERSPDDCRGDEPAQCRGSILRTCTEGRWASFDCDATGGVCAPATKSSPARCVFTLPILDADCGACGCPPDPIEEICDGKDNDADGTIDEDVACDPVPVVAVVITDERDDSSYSQEDVVAAIEELNTAFARDDGYGLVFELRNTAFLAEPKWLELEDTERMSILDVGELLARRGIDVGVEEFWVPMIFTDALVVGGVQRPGLSTVPNGTCGGLRRTLQREPAVGYLALAKQRWPTTLAHEMGHFLGLCHTHEAPPPIQQVGADGELLEAHPCSDRCVSDPDGLCDTAIDPGPESCGVDEECLVHCATGDRPDVRNMMAYYPTCRTLFSLEQALLMRESLAMRRAWHPCLKGDGCTCTPEEQNCPTQMNCEPFDRAGETVWSCEPEGAALPGGTCDSLVRCARGSICVKTPKAEGRCARTCTPGVMPCRCEPIDTPQVSVCREDLRMEGGG
jgi:hypothetical protein